MTLITTDSQHYTDIASAIRSKAGVQDLFKPSEMAGAIEAIPTGGGASLGSKTITDNGTYYASADSLDGYNEVVVDVSGGGGGGSSTLKIVDSDILHAIGSASSSGSGYVSRIGFPVFASCSTNQYAAIQTSNDNVLVRTYVDGGGNGRFVATPNGAINLQFAIEIPSDYTTVELLNTWTSGNANSAKCKVYFTDALGLTGYSEGNLSGTVLKSYVLADATSTAAAINAQSGIQINTTEARRISPAQNIVMDISSVSSACYLTLFIKDGEFSCTGITADVSSGS